MAASDSYVFVGNKMKLRASVTSMPQSTEAGASAAGRSPRGFSGSQRRFVKPNQLSKSQKRLAATQAMSSAETMSKTKVNLVVHSN